MWAEQSRRNPEDASEACCSGGVGMEEGKEQQAKARTHPAALYGNHCGHIALEKKPGGALWQPPRTKRAMRLDKTRHDGLR